ncbi:GtrA family protein [Bosea sp. BH3]|uniref:GtrA family protein n=1 Tax=Bosea sp. BH3 TaxID=2871701 RepID=UPI002A61D078|nr:GtrA family protein [Bosea sp. BH3]
MKILSEYDFIKIARFALIGALVTISYSLINLLLGERFIGLRAGWASLISFSICLLLSYFGHAIITYKISHNHKKYGLRYIAVTSALGIIIAIASDVMVNVFNVDVILTGVILSIVYPITSFVIHNYWTFINNNKI